MFVSRIDESISKPFFATFFRLLFHSSNTACESGEDDLNGATAPGKRRHPLPTIWSGSPILPVIARNDAPLPTGRQHRLASSRDVRHIAHLSATCAMAARSSKRRRVHSNHGDGPCVSCVAAKGHLAGLATTQWEGVSLVQQRAWRVAFSDAMRAMPGCSPEPGDGTSAWLSTCLAQVVEDKAAWDADAVVRVRVLKARKVDGMGVVELLLQDELNTVWAECIVARGQSATVLAAQCGGATADVKLSCLNIETRRMAAGVYTYVERPKVSVTEYVDVSNLPELRGEEHQAHLDGLAQPEHIHLDERDLGTAPSTDVLNPPPGMLSPPGSPATSGGGGGPGGGGPGGDGGGGGGWWGDGDAPHVTCRGERCHEIWARDVEGVLHVAGRMNPGAGRCVAREHAQMRADGTCEFNLGAILVDYPHAPDDCDLAIMCNAHKRALAYW